MTSLSPAQLELYRLMSSAELTTVLNYGPHKDETMDFYIIAAITRLRVVKESYVVEASMS